MPSFPVDSVFLSIIDERQIDFIDESSTEFLVRVHHQLASQIVGLCSSYFLAEIIRQNGQLHHLQIIGKYGVGFACFMTESPALDNTELQSYRTQQIKPERFKSSI